MWDVCLDICHFAGHVPSEYVRQLWDLLLKAAWDAVMGPADDGAAADDEFEAACVASGLEGASRGAGGGSPAAALEVACEQVRARARVEGRGGRAPPGARG